MLDRDKHDTQNLTPLSSRFGYVGSAVDLLLGDVVADDVCKCERSSMMKNSGLDRITSEGGAGLGGRIHWYSY